MSELMFDEFDKVSAKEWKQKIQFDLKGANYSDSLIWQSLEGIHVKPFYHHDDIKEDFTPFKGNPSSWNITQEIFIDDESIANKLALNTIDNGVESVLFISEKEFLIEILFDDFPFTEIPIYFNFKFLSEEFIHKLNTFLLNKNARVHYNIDIIGNLTKTGNWFHNLNHDHKILKNILNKYPSQNILSVDTALYQNAGANMVQQLAYGLAHANEYLNYFKNEPYFFSKILIAFNIAIGTNYFFEIAKIRALRILFKELATEYNISKNCFILARPSKRNKTIYDYNVNMLRTTTEYMSAIMGGANSICSLPYDVLFQKSNKFGERIARNQLIILKSESYFDIKNNPAEGSYYLESLTNQLAEKALSLFKDIEINGGFLHQLKEGTILRKIKESSDKEQQLFDSKQIVSVGTNKHPNNKDKMKDNLALFPFVKTKIRKTLIEPIIERRLSEKIEKERLNRE